MITQHLPTSANRPEYKTKLYPKNLVLNDNSHTNNCEVKIQSMLKHTQSSGTLGPRSRDPSGRASLLSPNQFIRKMMPWGVAPEPKAHNSEKLLLKNQHTTKSDENSDNILSFDCTAFIPRCGVGIHSLAATIPVSTNI